LFILPLYPGVHHDEIRVDRYIVALLTVLALAVPPAIPQEKEPPAITTRSQTPVVIQRLSRPIAFDGFSNEAAWISPSSPWS
jgi:hypothetical protein